MVDFGVAIVACLFLAQGIYLLKTGDVRWFFFHANKRESPPLKVLKRLNYAVPALIPGLGGLILVFTRFAENRNLNSSIRLQSLDSSVAIFAIIFSLAGLLFLFWPSILLKMARHAHPVIDVNSGVGILVARIVGAGFLAMAVIAIVGGK